jgi:hypothetical protein
MNMCMYRTGMIYVYVHMYLVGTLSEGEKILKESVRCFG